MSTAFDWLMRRTPQILVAFAVAIYLGTVITAVAAGQQMDFDREMLPVSVKARTFVIMFIQPLVGPMIMVAVAALLWRVDVFLRDRVLGTEA